MVGAKVVVVVLVEAATVVVETVAEAADDVGGVAFGVTVGVTVTVVVVRSTVVGGRVVGAGAIVLIGGRASPAVGTPGAATLSAGSPPHAPRDSNMMALTVLARIRTACLIGRRHVPRLAGLFGVGPTSPPGGTPQRRTVSSKSLLERG